MSVLRDHITCKSLFEAIAQGNDQAFKTLFEWYKAPAYAVAFKFTKSVYAAEEITQDVFISIWISRAQLPAVKDPEAYIYTIIYNKVSRYLKKESNTARILALPIWNTRAYSNETEETVFAHEQQKLIDQAIEQLSPQKKLIYRLNQVQGKSYDEIARTLHLSPNTVKSHVMKAIKFIRGCMKDHALLIAAILAVLSFLKFF
jgi:RNA polymerase sigma-70 factor (ECF subfamily)